MTFKWFDMKWKMWARIICVGERRGGTFHTIPHFLASILSRASGANFTISCIFSPLLIHHSLLSNRFANTSITSVRHYMNEKLSIPFPINCSWRGNNKHIFLLLNILAKRSNTAAWVCKLQLYALHQPNTLLLRYHHLLSRLFTSSVTKNVSNMALWDRAWFLELV